MNNLLRPTAFSPLRRRNFLTFVSGCILAAVFVLTPVRLLAQQQIWVKILRNGVISQIELENYVCGVIAGEISPSWPPEALKTMAVCARTFALNKVVSKLNNSYHITSSFLDQVYYEDSGRWASIRNAVAETKGEVLTYNGELAQVFFCASSGGCTASSFSVWGKDFPYLQAVPDPYSVRAEKYSSWSLVLNAADFLKILNLPGKLQAVSVVSRDESNRVGNLKISAGSREYFFTGKRLRETIGFDKILSTLFDVEYSAGRVTFSGQGWGHGVGLSQWGTKKMAEEGLRYEQILAFYFPGTVLGVIQ